MALAFAADGRLTIGDAGAIQQATTFSNNSGTITEHNSGVTILDGSTTTVVFSVPFGGITNPKAIFLKAVQDSNDTPKYIDVITDLTTPSIAMRCTELVMTLNDTGANIATLWVKTQTGFKTKLTHTIAG